MKYFEVGMDVWTLAYGKGRIDLIDDHEVFPIEATFENAGRKSFTHDGREWEEEEVILSKTPLQPIVNEPIKEKVMGYFWNNEEDNQALYSELGDPLDKGFVSVVAGCIFKNFSTEIPSHLK